MVGSNARPPFPIDSAPTAYVMSVLCRRVCSFFLVLLNIGSDRRFALRVALKSTPDLVLQPVCYFPDFGLISLIQESELWTS